MPKKTGKRRQHKKNKSPAKQPICGLSAAARCANIIFKTASDVEKFRILCMSNELVNKKKSWIGGTTAEDRSKICKYFGFDTTEINVSTSVTNKKLTVMQAGSTYETNISVKKLLNAACFYKSNNQYLLSVNAHCVYVKTNCTRIKMTVYDQRNKKMKIKSPDHAMKKLLRQRVRRLFMVSEISTSTRF